MILLVDLVLQSSSKDTWYATTKSLFPFWFGQYWGGVKQYCLAVATAFKQRKIKSIASCEYGSMIWDEKVVKWCWHLNWFANQTNQWDSTRYSYYYLFVAIPSLVQWVRVLGAFVGPDSHQLRPKSRGACTSTWNIRFHCLHMEFRSSVTLLQIYSTLYW